MKSRGFTIVELLIVIVVIGILAAIAILAYTGVQNRAVAASLTTDLENSAKQLKIYQASNSAYPTTIDCTASPAANSICLKTSTGTTYSTFTPNNTTSPQTFCLTATNGTTNYFVNQDGAPASGGCSITNILVNPNMESGSASGWNSWNGGGGSSYATLSTGGWSGSYFRRDTWASATPSSTGGIYVGNSVSTAPVTPGVDYTCSAYVRPSKSQTMRAGIEWKNSGGTIVSSLFSTQLVVPSGTWTRMSAYGTAAAGSVYAVCSFYAFSGTVWNPGDYLDADAAMLTQGPTLYNYADGSSPGWSWTGTANASTSIGVPL